MILFRAARYHIRILPGTARETIMASTTANFQSSHPFSQRLWAVKGDGDKTNDVFVCGEVNSQEHVIYFGGDVQNYPENMESSYAQYLHWNTERTASLLHHKFPKSLVFAIKAKQMELNTFAVYSNFVECNELGGPIHCSAYGAVRHLTSLYKSACKMIVESKRVQGIDAASNSDQCSTKAREEAGIPVSNTESKINDHNHIDEATTINIVGFSKGCVVLNQLVYEMPLVVRHDNDVKEFVSKIRNMYWLDGGHNAGDVDMSNQHAYITEPHLVASLAELDCHIHVYVTPYQVHDPLRPWLGKQYKRFCQLLRNSKANFTVEVHFEQEPGSLENHFKVLETFKT